MPDRQARDGHCKIRNSMNKLKNDKPMIFRALIAVKVLEQIRSLAFVLEESMIQCEEFKSS